MYSQFRLRRPRLSHGHAISSHSTAQFINPWRQEAQLSQRGRATGSVVENLKLETYSLRVTRVTQSDWKWYHSKALVRFPIRIPQQLWPYLSPFRRSTRTWHAHPDTARQRATKSCRHKPTTCLNSRQTPDSFTVRSSSTATEICYYVTPNLWNCPFHELGSLVAQFVKWIYNL